eukprot:10487286-Karenia_brevis.AAC.1
MTVLTIQLPTLSLSFLELPSAWTRGLSGKLSLSMPAFLRSLLLAAASRVLTETNFLLPPK